MFCDALHTSSRHSISISARNAWRSVIPASDTNRLIAALCTSSQEEIDSYDDAIPGSTQAASGSVARDFDNEAEDSDSESDVSPRTVQVNHFNKHVSLACWPHPVIPMASCFSMMTLTMMPSTWQSWNCRRTKVRGHQSRCHRPSSTGPLPVQPPLTLRRYILSSFCCVRVPLRLPPREVSSHLEELHRENLRKSQLISGTEAEGDDGAKHEEKKENATVGSTATVVNTNAATPATSTTPATPATLTTPATPPPRRPPARLPQEVRAPQHADSGSAPPLTRRSKSRLLPQATSEVKTSPARLIDPELSTEFAPWYILGKGLTLSGLCTLRN